MNWSRICIYFIGAFIFAVNAHGYRIDLFQPDAFSRVPIEHIAEKLAVKADTFLVEGFESEDLIEAIIANVPGGTGPDDGPSPNAWDGSRTSLEQNTASFSIEQRGIRVFGIGLGDNDFGQEAVSINESRPVSLNQLPNHRFTSNGKAYYILITAEQGDPDIRNVEVLNGFTIAFDHLILGNSAGSARSAPSADEPLERVRRLNAVVERISGQQPGISMVQQSVPVQQNKVAQPNLPARDTASSGIALLASEGTPFVGNQLQFFNRAEPGVLSIEKPGWLYLYWTEGRDFTLAGEVRLGGAFGDMTFSGDLPDGFALFLREWDGIHRYQLDSRRVLAKRRLLKGARIENIQQVNEFVEPAKNQWIPFHVNASQSGIHFRFGESTAFLEGPLDVDGANKIAIAPGTKLRNLRLAFGTPEESQRFSATTTISVSANRAVSPPSSIGGGPAINIVNGGFDDVPGEGDDTGQFGETMFSPGSERLPGWTVSDGLVGLRNDLKSPSGGPVLELGPRDTPGTVSQEIQSVSGQRYILSFYSCSGRGNGQIRVQAGDLDRTVECPPGATYQRLELPFRAISPVTEISFGGIGQAGFGPMIDDVRVELAGAE